MSRLGALLLAGLTVLTVAVACGDTGTPGNSATPGASGPVEPKPTHWPSGVVTAVVALGGADTDMKNFISTFQQAADDGDFEAMWGAADGLVTTVQSLQPNVDRLNTYEPTKGLAAKYNAALPVILQAAKDIRDAIKGGKPELVQDGTTRLIKGLEAYFALRDELAGWVAQSINQQKTLLQ